MVYVSSSCIKNNNIAEVVQMFSINGITNIELSGGTDHYDGIESDLKMLKQRYKLTYACHAYFPPPKVPFVVNLAACNDAIYRRSIAHYDECIDFLKKIECSVLSVHAGFLTEIGTDEIGRKLKGITIYDESEAYARFCYAYEKISKRCKEENIRLYLENNVLSLDNYEGFGRRNYFMMTDYRSIMRMRERINFNLLLDLGHLYVSTHTLGFDFEKECRQLKEHVRWLHISENSGICDEHKPLQKNSAIWKQLNQIKHSNIDITLETVGKIEDILRSKELVEE